jgi:hypothetical protein
MLYFYSACVYNQVEQVMCDLKEGYLEGGGGCFFLQIQRLGPKEETQFSLQH